MSARPSPRPPTPSRPRLPWRSRQTPARARVSARPSATRSCAYSVPCLCSTHTCHRSSKQPQHTRCGLLHRPHSRHPPDVRTLQHALPVGQRSLFTATSKPACDTPTLHAPPASAGANLHMNHHTNQYQLQPSQPCPLARPANACLFLHHSPTAGPIHTATIGGTTFCGTTRPPHHLALARRSPYLQALTTSGIANHPHQPPPATTPQIRAPTPPAPATTPQAPPTTPSAPAATYPTRT
jgi:hypothetical protein